VAYDLHVVRAVHWTDASEAPITKSEVDAIIEADSELAWSSSHFVQMKDHEGAVANFYMIAWKGVPCFWWYRDQLLCSSPNDAQVVKLVRIAAALGAHVVGDDGERYEIRRSILGKQRVVQLDS
jgi:hypothetical protein